jgi:eukaryotic-like serine/threonine-protein kinase
MAVGDKKEPNSGLWGKVELEDIPGLSVPPEESKEARLVTRKGTLMGFAAPVIGVDPTASPDANDPATRSTTPPARDSKAAATRPSYVSRPTPDQPMSAGGRTLIGGSFVTGTTKPAFNSVNPLSKGTLMGVPAPILEANPTRVSPTRSTAPSMPAQRGPGGPSTGNPEETSSNPQAGHLGRFRIMKRIGAGRAGAVFQAQRVDVGGSQQFLAIKVLREQVYQDQTALKALFREARLAAMMEHRNIVRVVDIGYHKRQPYLVMDYVDGLSLAALLAHPVAVPLAIGLRCITDALHGLDYAHKLTDTKTGASLGLVHCDVSPENILVGVDGFAKVTDFGVARTREEHGEEFMFRGKPQFAAPELLSGEQHVTPQTDVYGAGAVLFRVATGTVLFDAATDEERLNKAMTQAVPSLRQINPSLPAWLDEICARALSRDPGRRFASCAEMAQALEREAEREELHADRGAVGHWVSRVRRSLNGQEVFDINDIGSLADSAQKKQRRQIASTQLNAPAPVLPREEEESSSLQVRVGLGAALVLIVLVGGIWAIVAPNSFRAFITQKPVTYMSQSATHSAQPPGEPPLNNVVKPEDADPANGERGRAKRANEAAEPAGVAQAAGKGGLPQASAKVPPVTVVNDIVKPQNAKPNVAPAPNARPSAVSVAANGSPQASAAAPVVRPVTGAVTPAPAMSLFPREE